MPIPGTVRPRAKRHHDFFRIHGQTYFHGAIPELIDPEDAAWLTANASGIVIEVGTYTGASAEAILASSSVKQLICVDPFNGSAGDHQTCVWSPEAVFAMLQARLVKHVGRFTVMQTTSLNASCLLKDAFADMVFIDADHSYESVKQDIQIWMPKLHFGGLMCGHDYESRFPGVVKAVQEFAGTGGFAGSNSTIWRI